MNTTETNAKNNYAAITPLVLQLNDDEINNVIPVLIQYTHLFENEHLLKILNYLKEDKIAIVINGGLQLNKLDILLKWLQIISDIETDNLQIKIKLRPFYKQVFSALGLLLKSRIIMPKITVKPKLLSSESSFYWILKLISNIYYSNYLQAS